MLQDGVGSMYDGSGFEKCKEKNKVNNVGTLPRASQIFIFTFYFIFKIIFICQGT